MNIKSLPLSLLGVSVTRGVAVGSYYILNPKKSKNTIPTDTNQTNNTVGAQQQAGQTSSSGARQEGSGESSTTVNRGGSPNQSNSDEQSSSAIQSTNSVSESDNLSSGSIAGRDISPTATQNIVSEGADARDEDTEGQAQ